MKTLLSTFGTATLLIFSTAVASAQTDVFTDTFDAAPTNGATRVLSIDNSANDGRFPGLVSSTCSELLTEMSTLTLLTTQ